MSTTSPSPTPSPATSTPASRAMGLGEGIRSAMAGANISTNSVGTRSLGVAASNMAKNLQDNTDAIQKIIDAGDEETKKELAKLIKMMSDAQKMQGERQTSAVRNVVSQVKVLSETSVDLAEALDLKQTLKDLKPGSIGSRIQESLNVDQGAGFFGTIKQAFEPSRMFKGGSFFGLGRERFARINQEREFMARRQLTSATGGLSSAVGSLSLDEPTPATTLGTAPQATGRFQSGLDVLGEPERQTRLLEDILKELEKMNENGITSPAGAGILSNMLSGAVGAALAAVTTTLGRAVVTLARLGGTIGLAVTALYGIKKLYDFTKDDIAAAAPSKETLLRREMMMGDVTGTMRPSDVEKRKAALQEQIDNLPPEDRDGYVAPEELSIEEQNLNKVMEEFKEIERQQEQQEVINSMTPEQQEVINSMTPEQQEAYFSDTTPTLGHIELPAGVALGDGVDFTGPLGQTGEANNVIVEGTANGQIIKTTDGSFRVTDPISGKQVDFPSEERAQRALNGEYNYETGKFTDQYKDPDSYDPNSNSIDLSRLSEDNLQSSIVPTGVPTGDAIYNVGGAGQLTNLGGTTVINNNTTNNTAASPSSQIAIAIDAAGARSNSHTLKRKEDMRFMA